MASELSDLPTNQWPAALNRLRERAGAQEALVVTSSGRILFASGGSFAQLVPDLPSQQALRQTRGARSYAAVEPTDASVESRGLKLRVPVKGLRVKLIPTEDELDSCRELGRELARHLTGRITRRVIDMSELLKESTHAQG